MNDRIPATTAPAHNANTAATEADVPAYPVQNALMQPLRASAAERELTDYMSLWAGQAAATTRPRAARDYVELLVTETARILDR